VLNAALHGTVLTLKTRMSQLNSWALCEVGPRMLVCCSQTPCLCAVQIPPGRLQLADAVRIAVHEALQVCCTSLPGFLRDSVKFFCLVLCVGNVVPALSVYVTQFSLV